MYHNAARFSVLMSNLYNTAHKPKTGTTAMGAAEFIGESCRCKFRHVTSLKSIQISVKLDTSHNHTPTNQETNTCIFSLHMHLADAEPYSNCDAVIHSLTCDDVAKQPKNNLQGIKGREQQHTADASQKPWIRCLFPNKHDALLTHKARNRMFLAVSGGKRTRPDHLSARRTSAGGPSRLEQTSGTLSALIQLNLRGHSPAG